MEELFSRDRKIPRGLLILVPVVGLLIILGSATYQRTDIPVVGAAVPDFSAPLLVGDGTLALSDLRGKPVVVNFWASWCPPCKDEAPLFEAAYEEYGDRISFLGVDIRDARSDALEFVEEYGLDYPSVRDEGMKIYADYGLTGQPETYFIDAEGVLVEHVAGPVDEEKLSQVIDVLLRRDA